MIDYKKYINALMKCAKEHDNDTTPTFAIRVSDLCRDTANLLESLTRDFVVLPKISFPDLSTCNDMGEVSDGYHTFNQLYHQRAILFATIVNNFKSHAWKSLKHEDGKYCFNSDGKWFIVGVDTPEGSYTYHYETSKYWDIFDCEVLECGKHWDGHTEEDVTRLLSLTQYNTINDIRADIRRKMEFNSFNEGYVLYDDITEVLDKYDTDRSNNHDDIKEIKE